MDTYGQAANKVARSSRIEGDTERVKELTRRLRGIIASNTQNAHALGYFCPSEPGGTTGSAPTPVICTLSDALGELSRTVDELDGSMNLFN